MKTIIKYFKLLLITGTFISCSNPQPTELIEDSDPVEIEVVNKNLAEPTSFGIDSSGTNDNPSRFTNVITVSGIKLSGQSSSIYTSFAQAVFFDKSKPVIVRNNRIIGYNTITPGIVYFNNKRAEIRPLVIKYALNKDTLLGLRYILHSRAGLGDPFNFEYNSKINFKFEPILLPAISFDIPTPEEIFVTFKLSGKRQTSNINLLLEWNASRVKDFMIVLSVEDIPLYKIKTIDDGKFKVPDNILKEIASRFNRVSFTLIRKYEKHEKGNNSDLIVVSQSINTIIVDLP